MTPEQPAAPADDVPVTGSPDREREAWETPHVARVGLGAAEAFYGSRGDDGIYNLS